MSLWDLNELRILRQVRHPNLVIFHGACVTPLRGELARLRPTLEELGDYPPPQAKRLLDVAEWLDERQRECAAG